jgi:endogenous inhibitor of DNA gyrase (YacG/DUF329 family)
VKKNRKPTPASKPNPPESTPLKKGRCSRCGKDFMFRTVAEHKFFPFCSERCRDVDLGKWLTGGYAIPGAPVPPPVSAEADSEDEDAT